MAVSTTTTSPVEAATPAAIQGVRRRRRRISPRAGRALEILGHAIEYLADEMVHESAPISSQDGRLEAIQLLMRINRRIYFECPEVPGFWRRFIVWLRG